MIGDMPAVARAQPAGSRHIPGAQGRIQCVPATQARGHRRQLAAGEGRQSDDVHQTVARVGGRRDLQPQPVTRRVRGEELGRLRFFAAPLPLERQLRRAEAPRRPRRLSRSASAASAELSLLS